MISARMLMVKRGVLAIACLLISWTSVAADPAVEAFQDLIKSRVAAIDQKERVVPVQRTTQWVRSRWSISNIKYDVRKTDSLVTPLIGEVSFIARSDLSRAYNSKAEAEQGTVVTHSPTLASVTLRYAWRDGAWEFASGERTSSRDGKTQVTEASVPHTALLSPWVRLHEVPTKSQP